MCSTRCSNVGHIRQALSGAGSRDLDGGIVVLVRTEDGVVAALDQTSGAVKWRKARISSSPWDSCRALPRILPAIYRRLMRLTNPSTLPCRPRAPSWLWLAPAAARFVSSRSWTAPRSGSRSLHRPLLAAHYLAAPCFSRQGRRPGARRM